MTIICRLVIESHVPHVIAGVSPVLVHECGSSFEAVTPPGDCMSGHAVNSCKSQIILLVQL